MMIGGKVRIRDNYPVKEDHGKEGVITNVDITLPYPIQAKINNGTGPHHYLFVASELEAV